MGRMTPRACARGYHEKMNRPCGTRIADIPSQRSSYMVWPPGSLACVPGPLPGNRSFWSDSFLRCIQDRLGHIFEKDVVFGIVVEEVDSTLMPQEA